ncbi:MAG: hypothetical protein NTW49_12330, partial [Bacteroidia bacterium]|nr:hypothetical protein [Bacteroidia bacterium]
WRIQHAISTGSMAGCQKKWSLSLSKRLVRGALLVTQSTSGFREIASLSTFGHAKEVEYELYNRNI